MASITCNDGSSFKEVCKGLRQDELESVNITYSAKIDDESSWECLCDALRRATKLTSLTISNDGFGGYVSSNGVALPESLVCLNLAGSGVTLLEAILSVDLPNLQHFNLSSNTLQTSDMEELATFISRCPRLRTLMLANNDIGTKGIVKLTRTVPKSLRHVDLRGNFGNHQAYKHVCRWVEETPTLSCVQLDSIRKQELHYRLEMNRVGRPCLQTHALPAPLWACVLQKASASLTFTLLRERPDLVHQRV